MPVSTLLSRTSRGLVALFVVTFVSTASADPASRAAAEALFAEGKRLMNEGSLEEGCPKLAESDRLSPTSGAELALAYCYEKSGKTASAWGAYRLAEGRARTEGRRDREVAAAERSAALEKRLATLSLRIDGPAPTALFLDGVSIERASVGVRLPIDPGPHKIRATAPGMAPFELDVRAPAEGATAEAVVRLVPAPAENKPHVVVSPPRSPTSSVAEAGEPSFLRPAGFTLGALGIVAIGVSAAFGVRAGSLDSRSSDDCDGNVCGPAGRDDRLAAQSSGRISTGFFVAGGISLTLGIVMVLLAPKQTAPVSAYLGVPSDWAPR